MGGEFAMSVQKVVCTHCQSALKSDRPIPAGTQLKCPRCQKVFAVSYAPAAVGAGASRPPSGESLRTGPLPQLPGSTRPPSGEGIRPGTLPQVPASSRPLSGDSIRPGPLPPMPQAATSSPSGSFRPGVLPPVPAPTAPHKPNRTLRLAIVLFVMLLFVGGIGTTLTLLLRAENNNSKEVAAAQNNESETAPSVNVPPPGAVPTKPAPPPAKAVKPLIELKPEEDKRVKAMVDKNIEWLKREQKGPGFWGKLSPNVSQDQLTLTETALVMLTLLECGVSRNDPALVKARAVLVPQLAKMTQVQSIAIAILLLEKLNDEADKDLLEMLALRLMAAQRANGAWAMPVPDDYLSKQELREFSELLKAIKLQTRDAYSKALGDKWGKTSGKIKSLPMMEDPPTTADKYNTGDGDNENSHFAMLALWKARGKGIPVDRSLRLAAERFKHTQAADGSWTEKNRKPQEHPVLMGTVGGLFAMAVSHGINDKIPAGFKNDPKFIKGLEALDKATKAEVKFLAEHIWAVERVAVVLQLPKIKDRDWYRWGLPLLEKGYNSKDGGVRMGDPGSDTCHALLFLKQVNLAADLSEKLAASPPPAQKPPTPAQKPPTPAPKGKK